MSCFIYVCFPIFGDFHEKNIRLNLFMRTPRTNLRRKYVCTRKQQRRSVHTLLCVCVSSWQPNWLLLLQLFHSVWIAEFSSPSSSSSYYFLVATATSTKCRVYCMLQTKMIRRKKRDAKGIRKISKQNEQQPRYRLRLRRTTSTTTMLC